MLLGQMHVAPVVTEFLGAHPGVTVRLILSDTLANIVEEGRGLTRLARSGR